MYEPCKKLGYIKVIETIKERLSSKLKAGENGCLIFVGARNKAGYANLYAHSEDRKTITHMAHRVAWELANGPIPGDRFVLHRCDTPSCCNPEHLFLGTQADNMQDKANKSRAKPGPSSTPEWWTPERKKERGRISEKWQAEKREAAAVAAGFPTDWKFCPACKAWKPRDGFGNNRARHDGLQAHCKPCKSDSDIALVRRKKRITAPLKTKNP